MVHDGVVDKIDSYRVHKLYSCGNIIPLEREEIDHSQKSFSASSELRYTTPTERGCETERKGARVVILEKLSMPDVVRMTDVAQENPYIVLPKSNQAYRHEEPKRSRILDGENMKKHPNRGWHVIVV